MKNLFKITAALLLSFLLAGTVCTEIGHAEYTNVVGLLLFAAAFVKLPQGIALVGINVSQIATELGAYFRVNSKIVKAMVYQESQLSKYTRTITKVKGRFPAIHSVTGNVIQGFQATWNEVGETKFKVNELTAYHQKVNFPIIPANIEPSWLAELAEEEKTPLQKSISQYIVEKEIKPRVIADVDYLSGNGAYDANDLATFGKSMNGLKAILAAGVASSTNPMYKIPLAALTASNIVAQVEFFEDQIPTNVRRFINKIYMSTRNRDRFMKASRDQFGGNWGFTKDQALMTYTGEREIVGLDCMNGSDVIFATPDDNFLKLVDFFNEPAVTDVQVYDYKVKVFMEFWLGFGFWMNQLVLCSVTNGSGSGLTTDNDSYYLPGQIS